MDNCPFCGSKPSTGRDKSFMGWRGHYIACINDKCELNPSTALHKTQAAAEKVWDKRKSK